MATFTINPNQYNTSFSEIFEKEISINHLFGAWGRKPEVDEHDFLSCLNDVLFDMMSKETIRTLLADKPASEIERYIAQGIKRNFLELRRNRFCKIRGGKKVKNVVANDEIDPLGNAVDNSTERDPFIDDDADIIKRKVMMHLNRMLSEAEGKCEKRNVEITLRIAEIVLYKNVETTLLKDVHRILNEDMMNDVDYRPVGLAYVSKCLDKIDELLKRFIEE